MGGKPTFTDEELDILFAAAARARKQFKSQEDMALALGITQGSVSNLLKRKWAPGIRIGREIATLCGHTLEDLLEPAQDRKVPEAPDSRPASRWAERSPDKRTRFPNLDICVQFHHGVKAWSEWTIATAEAGFFGPSDFPPPAWPEKLDALEKALDKARKAIA